METSECLADGHTSRVNYVDYWAASVERFRRNLLPNCIWWVNDDLVPDNAFFIVFAHGPREEPPVVPELNGALV